jgi:hypothetical protein
LQDYNSPEDVRARIWKYVEGNAPQKNVIIYGRLGEWSLRDMIGYGDDSLSVDSYNLDGITDLTTIPGYSMSAIRGMKSFSATQVTSVAGGAFMNCASLKNVNLPLVKEIGPEAFERCTALTSISLPSATFIDGLAFYDCTSLTTAYFPSLTGAYALIFKGCNTENIDLTINVSQFGYIADKTWNYYLEQTATFKSITIAGTITINLDEYNNEDAVADVVHQYDKTATGDMSIKFIGSLGDKSFSSICKNINNEETHGIYMNLDDVSDLTSIPEACFGEMTWIKGLSSTNVTAVERVAFIYSSIQNLVLPNAISIGDTCFFDCENITTLYLTSCTSVGGNAFDGCTTSNIRLTLGSHQKSNAAYSSWNGYTFLEVIFVD